MRIELIWNKVQLVPQIKVNSSTEEIQRAMNMKDKYMNFILLDEAKQVSTCTLCQLMGGNAKEFSYIQLNNFNHHFRNSHPCLGHCHHCLALNIQILNCCGRIFASNAQKGCKSKKDVSSCCFSQRTLQNDFSFATSTLCYHAQIFSYSAQEHTPLTLLGQLLKRANSNYCSICQPFSE